MGTTSNAGTALDDIKIHVRLKLAALWTAVMLCYLYGDFIGLLRPGKLAKIIAGTLGSLGPITQGVLLGIAILMAIPAVMVFLSIALKPSAARWANIVLGALYTLIMLVTMPGAWTFYVFLGVIEVALTVLIVWYAWTWPKRDGISAGDPVSGS